MRPDREHKIRLTFWESIPAPYRTLENWPNADREKIKDAKARARYDRLVKACGLFLKKEFAQAIQAAGCGQEQLLKLMRRALLPVKTGDDINGTRAFVRNLVQIERRREAAFTGAGYMGIFGK